MADVFDDERAEDLSNSADESNTDDLDLSAEESLDDDEDLDGGVIHDDYDDFDDDDEDDYDDYDDYEDYEDATVADVDFVVALYREDGEPTVVELPFPAANDLDEMISQLSRLPGDGGALGVVSIAGEFFVLCRVRGTKIQVLLNDSLASCDWPIARDVMDYLGIEVPSEDDDDEVIGDLGMLEDQGVSEFEMEQIAGDADEDSDQLVLQIVDEMHFGAQFDKVVN